MKYRLGIESERSFKFIYDFKQGDNVIFYKNYIIVANPRHKPKMISLVDGSIKNIEPGSDNESN